MDVAFVVRVAIVSGLAALAFVLLRDGLSAGRAGIIGTGAVIGVLALGGIIALMRIVVTAERRSQERRRP
jgi:hypothetical protein